MTKLFKSVFSLMILSILIFMSNNAYAANISEFTLTPDSTTPAVSTNHTVTFRTSNTGAIPQNGMIKVTYPAGFNLSNVTLGGYSGNLGSPTLTKVVDTVFLTLDSTSSVNNSSIVSFQLLNAINTSTSGNYSISLETRNSSGQTIDGPNVSSNFTIGLVQILDHFSVVPSVTNTTVSNNVNLTITAQDNTNATFTSYNGTPALSGLTTSPNATAPYYGPAVFTNGVAIVTIRSYSSQANQSVTITDSGKTGNSGVINFAVGALGSINISPSTSQTITAGQTIQFIATNFDSYGNSRTGDMLTWTNTNNTGLFTNTISGTYSVKATSGLIDSNLVNITVTHAEAIDHLTISPTNIHLSNADQSQKYIVWAIDQYGNSWDVSNQASYSTSDPKGSFTSNIYNAGKVGSWQITATFGGKSISTNVIIDNTGAPSKVESTNTVSQIDTNSLYQFTVKVYDADGNEISNPSLAWSITEGSANAVIDSQGRFLANKSGNYKVKVESGNAWQIFSFEVKDVSTKSNNSTTNKSENASSTSTSKSTSSTNDNTTKSSSQTKINEKKDIIEDTIVEVADDSLGKIKASEIVTEGLKSVENEDTNQWLLTLSIIIGLAILGLSYWGYTIWSTPIEATVSDSPITKPVKDTNVDKPMPKEGINSQDDKTRW